MTSITITSNDGKEFSVNPLIFQGSKIYKYKRFLTSSISSDNLESIIQWCDFHYNFERSSSVTKHYKDKLRPLWKWEDKFLQLSGDILLDIILAADHLDIRSLVQAGCRRAAYMIKAEDLDSVARLPERLIAKIASNLPPYAPKRATERGVLSMTAEQTVHNEIWTGLMNSDEWCDAALDLRMNPVLIGDFERDEKYLVLSAMDWDGELEYIYELNAKPIVAHITRFLKGHKFNRELWECEMEDSKITLNISGVRRDYSTVKNAQDRLVTGLSAGQQKTSVMHLASPKIHSMTT